MKYFHGPLFKILCLATLLFMLFLTGCQQQMEYEKETEPWVGKWILKSAVNQQTREEAKVQGIFHLYENGTFTSQTSWGDRPAAASGTKTLEDYKELFNTYRAGYGTYTINATKDTLSYVYSHNMRPHRINDTPTVFYFKVTGDTMIVKHIKWHEILIREKL